MTFQLTSDAFNEGEFIPALYSCKGEDISVPLAWIDSPVGTQSFVLIMDDPDAPMGIWDHWILFNIPPEVFALPANLKSLPPATQEGVNSWNRTGYGGPCPPSGTHRYFFKLYALDVTLDLTRPDKKQVEQAMEGHILAQAQLMGCFQH